MSSSKASEKSEKNVVTKGSHKIISRLDISCSYSPTSIHKVLVWGNHSFLTVLNTELVSDIAGVRGAAFVVSSLPLRVTRIMEKYIST